MNICARIPPPQSLLVHIFKINFTFDYKDCFFFWLKTAILGGSGNTPLFKVRPLKPPFELNVIIKVRTLYLWSITSVADTALFDPDPVSKKNRSGSVRLQYRIWILVSPKNRKYLLQSFQWVFKTFLLNLNRWFLAIPERK